MCRDKDFRTCSRGTRTTAQECWLCSVWPRRGHAYDVLPFEAVMPITYGFWRMIFERSLSAVSHILLVLCSSLIGCLVRGSSAGSNRVSSEQVDPLYGCCKSGDM
jgi:hypothetical protein